MRIKRLSRTWWALAWLSFALWPLSFCLLLLADWKIVTGVFLAIWANNIEYLILSREDER